MEPSSTRILAAALLAAAALVSLGTLPWVLATAVLAACAVFAYRGQRWASLAALAVAVIDGVIALLILLGLVLFLFLGDAGIWHVFFLLSHGAAAIAAGAGAVVADRARRGQHTQAGESGLDATSAIKSFGRAAGRWSVNTVKSTPQRVREMKDDLREKEEQAARLRRAREDRLVREERVHAAREARRRRTGSIF
ncbi:MAG: hypothetical protein ACTMKY_13210 [Dermabacteraceae bacterium]